MDIEHNEEVDRHMESLSLVHLKPFLLQYALLYQVSYI